MTSLAWLIPVALLLGGLGLAAFLWSLKQSSSRISKALPGARSTTRRRSPKRGKRALKRSDRGSLEFLDFAL